MFFIDINEGGDRGARLIDCASKDIVMYLTLKFKFHSGLSFFFYSGFYNMNNTEYRDYFNQQYHSPKYQPLCLCEKMIT